MLTTRLFLGFPTSEATLSPYINEITSETLSLYLQGGEEYLEEVFFHQAPYWGKFVVDVTDLPALELLELNIYSMLKKIIPDYPFEKIPLLLFPVYE